MLGTPLVGSVDWFLRTYGKSAAHEVVTRISPQWRNVLLPHAPMLGIVGGRKYPYAFIGEMVLSMAKVVHAPDEDEFIRDLAGAGIDAAVSTAMRVLLRYAATPASLAARSQEAWDMFMDCGRVSILSIDKNEYVAQVTEWSGHDVTVCKVVMEVRRRLIERTGARNVTARREKCQAWGHPCCTTRVQWE